MKEFWAVEYYDCPASGELCGPFEACEDAERFATKYPGLPGRIKKLGDFMGWMWSPTTHRRRDVWLESGSSTEGG